MVNWAGTDQVGSEHYYCFLLGLSRVWQGMGLAEPMWECVCCASPDSVTQQRCLSGGLVRVGRAGRWWT